VAASRRVDGAAALDSDVGPTLVAIGNFDGVHLGHRAVLASARALAQKGGLALVVLTFDPHPSEVLGRGHHAVLTPLDRKVELLTRLDPEIHVVVEPFTKELSLQTPRTFASDLLRGLLHAAIVVVGQNFRFGHQRAGDLALLSELGTELGFEARAESLAGDGSGAYSSSRIRAALAAGRVDEAARLLGRPHALTGKVIRGDGRGRTIGIPTANLDGVEELVPPAGVYAALVDRVLPDGARRLGTAAVNIGVRPTVQAGFSIEAHVLDLDEDLYGSALRLHLVSRLRDETRFPSLDALVLQIRRDVEATRAATESAQADPAAGGAWA
jgi:riboflavin kinase/FMN adenylyltransferase